MYKRHCYYSYIIKHSHIKIITTKYILFALISFEKILFRDDDSFIHDRHDEDIDFSLNNLNTMIELTTFSSIFYRRHHRIKVFCQFSRKRLIQKVVQKISWKYWLHFINDLTLKFMSKYFNNSIFWKRSRSKHRNLNCWMMISKMKLWSWRSQKFWGLRKNLRMCIAMK